MPTRTSSIDQTQLILFSGLSANEKVLAKQKHAFAQLEVPEWLVPQPEEKLEHYCARFAAELAPEPPLVIGGVSFGGIVALTMAKYVRPACVVLISSVRSPDELPRRIRLFRPFRHIVRWVPITLLQWMAASIARGSRKRISVGEVARQFRDADPRVMRWSLYEILSWRETPELPCPVYHIHGGRDFVFPLSLTNADRDIPDGGHLICLTHADQVNDFLRECLDKSLNQPG